MQRSHYRVVPVAPDDEAALQTYHATFSRGSEADRIDPTTWTLDEVRVQLRQPGTFRKLELYIAYAEDGTPVGAGDVVFPQQDNTTLAQCDFAVPPEFRRQGVGSAMFGYLRELAKANGRTSVYAEVDIAPGNEQSAPAAAFLSKQGLTHRNTEIRRQLKLPIPADKLDALAAKAAERSGDYRIQSWTGACPEEYAEQYAALKGRLSTDAPLGDVEFEQEKWDVQRLREGEARSREQGRVVYTTVAVAPDGALAAHTQAGVRGGDADRAFQWDTLVVPEHRGHRLGLAVKVANVRALQAAHPEAGRMDTWNAEQNGPMVAVNLDLGFEIIEYAQDWQGSL
ncbi:GNAT family N-acetyltransferase [Flindersiella endophytica]